MPALDAFVLLFGGVVLLVVAWVAGASPRPKGTKQVSDVSPSGKSRALRSVAFLLVLIAILATANAVSPLTAGARLFEAAVSRVDELARPRMAAAPTRGESVTIGHAFVEVRGVQPHQTAYVSFVARASAGGTRQCAPESCEVLQRVVQSVRTTEGAGEPVDAQIFPITADETGVGRTTIPTDAGLDSSLFSAERDRLTVVLATQANGELVVNPMRPHHTNEAVWVQASAAPLGGN